MNIFRHRVILHIKWRDLDEMEGFVLVAIVGISCSTLFILSFFMKSIEECRSLFFFQSIIGMTFFIGCLLSETTVVKRGK